MKESIGITLAIFEHDAEITKLRMINDQKDGIILALRTDVVDRDKHIDEVKVNLDRFKFLYDECRVDVGRGEKFIQMDQRTIQELRSTVAGRDMAIDEKNSLLNTKQAVINQLKRQINRLESTYDSMYSAMLEDNQAIMKDLKKSQRDIGVLDAELSVRKQDSKVLMQVVEDIRLYQDDKHDAVSTVIAIKCLLVDYLDVPEVPGILTLHTPSIGMRLVSKVDARKAELHKKEINRLRRILGTADKEINELSSRYCDRCDQLEKIETLTMDAVSYVHIDDIRKIIMEK